MKTYSNIHTGEEVSLDTQEKIHRFFDNRCPSDWIESPKASFIAAMQEHRLPTCRTSMLSDAFQLGWMAAKRDTKETKDEI